MLVMNFPLILAALGLATSVVASPIGTRDINTAVVRDAQPVARAVQPGTVPRLARRTGDDKPEVHCHKHQHISKHGLCANNRIRRN
ncbi:unnamed protein product [Clonostachys rosea f. rosea IK726]|uniref:Uncharacterized protein n=2 Tax=Bionectria ochroleuca TaxID=29856 RepID=A0A8H7N614_BIOOC|nr:unnamed protein product [Clonostachys rosea f. rosea IK726]